MKRQLIIFILGIIFWQPVYGEEIPSGKIEICRQKDILNVNYKTPIKIPAGIAFGDAGTLPNGITDTKNWWEIKVVTLVPATLLPEKCATVQAAITADSKVRTLKISDNRYFEALGPFDIDSEKNWEKWNKIKAPLNATISEDFSHLVPSSGSMAKLVSPSGSELSKAPEISESGFYKTLVGGYPACLTKELFDQWGNAIARKDEMGAKYLLQNGCIITKTGLQFSVLDTGFLGWAQIRVYLPHNEAVELWTNIENIRPMSKR